MIWIILLIVLGIILYSFFSTREKMNQQVVNRGGMEEKYSILISYLLADPGANIIQLTKDNIQIQAKTQYSISHFSILQIFNGVIITWKAKSPMGEFQDKWQFPENLDQHQMAKKVASDIKFKFENFGNHEELQRRINNAMDELKF